MDYYFDQSSALEAGARPVKILVTGSGFSPSRIEAAAGRPLTLRFFRTTDQTCAKEVVFPSLGLSASSPFSARWTSRSSRRRGEIAFSCSMGMITGAVVGR